MSPYWRFFLPGYLLALPHTLIGLLLAVFVYRCHSWCWSDGCIEAVAGRFPVVEGEKMSTKTRIWGRPWAQTHGFFIVYDTVERVSRPSLRGHERVHVVQAFVGSVLYPIAYGACFAWFYALQGFKGDWKVAYKRNPFEAMAYGRQGRPGIWGA